MVYIVELKQQIKYSFYNNFKLIFSIVTNESGRKLISGTILHACDLYSSTKQFEISKEWSKRINQEFANQIEDEKKMGLPLTPYMLDLDKSFVMAKQEIQFIKVIQKPIWVVINRFLDGYLDEAIRTCESNVAVWEKILSGEKEL